jgi:hypothetical protein
MGRKGLLIFLSVLTVALLIGSVGCKSGLESEDISVRTAAVERLTDQAVLAKVAIGDKDEYVRRAAVERLTDQAVLAKVAIEDKDENVRETAVRKITDQALLTRVAIGDKDEYVRRAAVERLTDQAVLAKVAIGDKDGNVRWVAVERLVDPALKAQLKSPVGRANLIGELQDSDPILMKIATDRIGATLDASECIARMKLAVREPRIQSRFPGLQCKTYARETGQRYLGSGILFLHGETVFIRFHQNGKTLAEARWHTEFPPSTTSSYFKPADVNGGELLKKLFHLRAFTPEDLAEFCRSKIPEVRIGAGGNITDQALLAKLAIEDDDWCVRQTAVERLSSQAALAKVALEDKEPKIRLVAIEALTDQAVLARVAIEESNWRVRVAAVEKLTDQAVLAKVGIEDKVSSVRDAAKNRISTLRLKQKQ